MNIMPLKAKGLYLIESERIMDGRGFFSRLYCMDAMKDVCYKDLVQINTSFTKSHGSVRGMHFQRPPYSEKKIVYCLSGACFDVAVDLRKNSSTYLRWFGQILSADNNRAMLIPEGFAHGFQTLTDDVRMLYFHTEFYTPEAEGRLHYLDPAVAINWPEPIGFVSEKDRSCAYITDSFEGIEL